MNRFDKFAFLSILHNDVRHMVRDKKKAISNRVFEEFYYFISQHYNGTFAEWLDNQMKNYCQVNNADFIKWKYKVRL